MNLKIYVTLKKAILDPQGEAIRNALNNLNFNGITNVRQGKVIHLDLQENDRDVALMKADEMCKKLLANTTIEDYEIELD